MIQSIYINNFKSYLEFSTELSPVTIIAGDNGSGKSSFLQALAFLKAACTGSVYNFLDARNLEVNDIVSNVAPKLTKIITFSLEFAFPSGSELQWDITFITERSKNKIALRSEQVADIRTEEIYLSYDSTGGQRINEKTGSKEPLPAGTYDASLMKIIDIKQKELFPHLFAIRNFFENTEVLDLLNPRQMRRSSRVSNRALGEYGEKLPSLIYLLSREEKDEIRKNLQKLLPNLSDVDSSVGRAGWTRLATKENYQGLDHSITVPAGDISDGTLRLIALFSIQSLNHSGGALLLDEVEDGINARNLEAVLKFFQEYQKQKNQQIIITTHSSILLDYADPEMILCFLRDDVGRTICFHMEDSSLLREKLEFLYPGEALTSLSKEEWSKASEEQET